MTTVRKLIDFFEKKSQDSNLAEKFIAGKAVKTTAGTKFEQTLSEWKRREINPTVVNSKVEELEETVAIGDKFEDASADNIKKYEASKKLNTFKKAKIMITNAIEEQEKYKYRVVEARIELHTRLCVDQLQKYESIDELQPLKSILPPSSMLYNQATKAIQHVENQHVSRTLAITSSTDIPVTSIKSAFSDDPLERKIQIDKECDEFLELVEAQIAGAKKITSGTKKEIKIVALLQKIAENIQGDFQPEVMAMLNKELTPENSSSLSEESYKRMYRQQ